MTNRLTIQTSPRCAEQAARVMQGRLLGRSAGDCPEAPGTWDPCLPRNVQWSVENHIYDGTTAATAAASETRVRFRNGTKHPIGIYDFVVDSATYVDPVSGDREFVPDGAISLVDIIGAESSQQSYGTFAGSGSEVVDAAGAIVGSIGTLGDGIDIVQLGPERQASYGASANYGSILSKMKLPVVEPQQIAEFVLRASPESVLAAQVWASVFIRGQIVGVQVSQQVIDHIADTRRG